MKECLMSKQRIRVQLLPTSRPALFLLPCIVVILALIAAEPLRPCIWCLVHIHTAQMEPFSRALVVVTGYHVAVADLVAVAIPRLVAVFAELVGELGGGTTAFVVWLNRRGWDGRLGDRCALLVRTLGL